MKTLKYKKIEYSEVFFAELGQEMRFDADYWDPTYLRNEDIITAKNSAQTKVIAPNPQYGISVAMNEENNGYSILKMDNIMEMLAEDKNAKYADISKKTLIRFQLKKFDILFNRVNSDEFVGRTGIYLLNGQHTFASYLVKVDSGKEHTNCYLTAYLNCKYGKTALQRVKRRAVNQANINAKELSNLNIPVANENLQKRIQALIVEAQHQKNLSEKYHSEASKYFLNCLSIREWKPKTKDINLYGVSLQLEDSVNFDVSVTDMFSNNRLDAEFWQPKFLNAISALQNGGKYKPLSEIAIIRKGNQARQVEGINSGIPYASIKDCENLEISTSEFTDAKKPVAVLPSEIVLAITGATIGKSAINNTTSPIAISGDLAAIYSTKIPQNYLLAVLSSVLMQQLCIRYTTGATNGHLAVRDVAKFPIPLLDKNSMEVISNKMIEYFKGKSKSKQLLEVTKKAVEIFIEQDEKAALKYININEK